MDKMKLVVFLIALISWIVISKMVFQKVRRDYTEQGKLTKLSSFLQIIIFALIVLSVPFFWNSLLALIAALVYWVGARMMVMAEEEHLHGVFGQEYDKYCKRTPRYLGVFRGWGCKV